MYRFKTLLAIVGIVLISQTSWSQTSCSDQLRLAQRRYDSGLLDDIPGILLPCLDKGFTQEEKANAYKMLIQTYLFSDLPEKADEIMLRFLREFPEYILLPNDHSEFKNLYGTYRTTPIMKIELSLGTNLSMPWVKEFYGPEDLNNLRANYSSTFGANLELNYINTLFGDFEGSFGVSSSFLRIGYSNQPYDHTTITATYNSLFVGVPLALRYKPNFNGIDFFVKAGFEPVYQLLSTVSYTREVLGEADPYTGSVSVQNLQRQFDIRPILSVGMNFKLFGRQFMATAGMKFGTVIPMKQEARYTNDELYLKPYIIPDDYLVHQAFVNLSYVFSVYNPKKTH